MDVILNALFKEIVPFLSRGLFAKYLVSSEYGSVQRLTSSKINKPCYYIMVYICRNTERYLKNIYYMEIMCWIILILTVVITSLLSYFLYYLTIYLWLLGNQCKLKVLVGELQRCWEARLTSCSQSLARSKLRGWRVTLHVHRYRSLSSSARIQTKQTYFMNGLSVPLSNLTGSL